MDINAFVGTFEQTGQEDLQEVLQAMEISEEMAKTIVEAKHELVTKVLDDGTIESNMKVGEIERIIKFKLGEEFEHELLTGEKVKSIVKLEDGKLIEEQLTGKAKGKKTTLESISASGDLKMSIVFGGANGSAIYKKSA